MAFKLVIFDCDGVLVDSEGLGNAVFAAMLAEHGLRIPADETARRFRGMNVTKCLEILERETGISLPDAFETDLRQRMSVAFKAQLQRVDGALRLVESLKVPFCVASSGPLQKIEKNLQITSLYPYFHGKIFSGYEVGSWKPDPGLFLSAAEYFGAAPGDSIVIEDSFVGVSAGIAAGMTVLGLNTGENDKAVAAANRVFASLEEIHGYFVAQDLSHQ